MVLSFVLLFLGTTVAWASYENPPSSLVRGERNEWGAIGSTGTATFYLSDGVTTYKYVINIKKERGYADPWGTNDYLALTDSDFSYDKNGPTLVKSGTSGPTFEAPKILDIKTYVTSTTAWKEIYYDESGTEVDWITHEEYKNWGTMSKLYYNYGISIELENTIKLSTGYKLDSSMDTYKYGTKETPYKYNHSYDSDGAYWHDYGNLRGVVVDKNQSQKETVSTSFRELIDCTLYATRYVAGGIDETDVVYVQIPKGENSFEKISAGTGNSIVINGELQNFSGTTWVFEKRDENGNHYIAQETDEVEFVFKVVPKNYKVTFNANGGTLTDYADMQGTGSGKTSTWTNGIVYNESYYDNVSQLAPVRAGYAFTGWYDSSGTMVWDENGKAYTGASGTKYWTSNGKWKYDGNVTVYAGWEQSTTWVVFDANWGTLYKYWDDGSDSAFTRTMDSTSTYLEYGRDYYDDISGLDPKRDGFVFEGWYTDPDNTENGRDNGVNVWDANGKAVLNTTYNGEGFWEWDSDANDNKWVNKRNAITVFAHWRDVNVNPTLTVDPNGGTWNGSSLKQDFSLATGATKTIADPTRQGYRFKEWSLSSTSTGSSISGTTFKMGTVSVTLTAQWEKVYTLTVNPNGGTWNGSTSSKSFSMIENETKIIGSATKPGYTFVGWLNSTNGTISSIQTFKMGTSDVTLTAQWDINESTLKIDPNGGTWNGFSAVQTYEGTYNSTMLVPVPTREGYTFKGWTKSNPFYGSITSLTSSATYTFGANNGTTSKLTAKWEINSYNVNLIAGYGMEEVSGGGTYQYGKPVTITAKVQKGFHWKNWTGTLGTLAGEDVQTYTFLMPAKNVTMTANAEANQYTIKFHPNDGAVVTPILDIVVKYDQKVTLPIGTPSFVKYTIDGVNVTNEVLSGNIQVTSEDGEEVEEVNEEDLMLLQQMLDEKMLELNQLKESETTTVEELSRCEMEAVALIEQVNLYESQLEALAESVTENAYPSIFKGWSLETERTLFVPTWVAEEEMLVKTIVDAAGLENEHEVEIILYAIWDDCPWIVAEDLYYTLKEAQEGFITHDELMSHASASDRENGNDIPPGDDAVLGTSFKVIDYLPEDFTSFTAEGSVTETYQVIDSAGNTYKKMITVYIVDSTPQEVKPIGTTRFINEKYYYESYENGGLEDNSVWKTDPEYVAVIKESFENSKNDTPIISFYFTHETILEMKKFVEENGFGNTQSEDALQRFYDTFMAPNVMN